MRKTITYLSVIVVSLLAGCTGYWTDPTQWREQYTEAATVCQRYVRTDNQLFSRCMSVHGWTQSDQLLRNGLP
jgi:hypothetical protein